MPTIADLERKHPDYDAGCLRDLEVFYMGGQALLGSIDGDEKPSHADALLRMLFDIPDASHERFFRRIKEPAADYADRKRRAYALGYMGSIVDFFAATTLGDPPHIEVKGGDASFWEEFEKDCDRAGTDLSEFARARLVEALVFRRAYAYADTPPPAPEKPVSLAEQDEFGERRAYLTPICAHELIDWEKDDRGGFSFFVIRQEHRPRATLSGDRTTRTLTWRVWEGGRIFVFEKSLKDGEEIDPKEDLRPNASSRPAADGLAGYPAAECPLVELAVPCGLHVGGKLLSAEREVFNKQNALSYAEYRCAFSFLKAKVKDAEEFRTRNGSKKLGDASTMLLMPDEDALWESHPPAALADLRASLDRTKEEIHRVASQLALAAPLGAVAQAASGEAKRRDMQPTAIVAGALGKVLREWIEEVVETCATLRGEDVEPTISGLETYEDVVETLLRVLPELRSPTAEAEARKRLVAQTLPHLTPEQQAAVAAEIEQRVTADEAVREEQQAAETKAMQAAGMGGAGGAARPGPRGLAAGGNR